MPDTTLSEALQEAYASHPAETPLVDTLSFYYDGLVDAEGADMEVYIFQGFVGDRTSPEGVPLKDFRLEPGARFLGGEVVEFLGLPFEIVLPDVTTQPLAKGQLVVDGVGREITDKLLEAVALGVSLQVTYRGYLEGLEDDGPQHDPPIRFGLSNVTANALQIRGDITVTRVGNGRSPAETYTIERFAALGN